MRSTLQAAHIMVNLRGMTPLSSGGDDIPLSLWLEQREMIESLEEQVFEDTASIFAMQMLYYDNKHVLLERVDELVPKQKKKKKKKKKAKSKRGSRKRRVGDVASDDDDDGVHTSSSSSDDEDHEGANASKQITEEKGGYVLHSNGNVYSISRMLSSVSEFVPHLCPLVFGCIKPLERRPHMLLTYPLAVVVHIDEGVAAVNLAVKNILTRLAVVRRERASMFGYTDANADVMPCRVMLILWGAGFAPKNGRQYKSLRANIASINRAQRDSGNNITFEMFSVIELQADLSKHEDAGTYEAIADPSTVPELSTIKSHQFRYLRDTDRVARLYDFQPGQIVRALREDFELGGTTYDYYVVVAHDRLLEARDDDDGGGGGGGAGGGDEEDGAGVGEE